MNCMLDGISVQYNKLYTVNGGIFVSLQVPVIVCCSLYILSNTTNRALFLCSSTSEDVFGIF